MRKHPLKYIRKYMGPNGKWVYVYYHPVTGKFHEKSTPPTDPHHDVEVEEDTGEGVVNPEMTFYQDEDSGKWVAGGQEYADRKSAEDGFVKQHFERVVMNVANHYAGKFGTEPGEFLGPAFEGARKGAAALSSNPKGSAAYFVGQYARRGVADHLKEMGMIGPERDSLVIVPYEESQEKDEYGESPGRFQTKEMMQTISKILYKYSPEESMLMGENRESVMHRQNAVAMVLEHSDRLFGEQGSKYLGSLFREYNKRDMRDLDSMKKAEKMDVLATAYREAFPRDAEQKEQRAQQSLAVRGQKAVKTSAADTMAKQSLAAAGMRILSNTIAPKLKEFGFHKVSDTPEHLDVEVSRRLADRVQRAVEDLKESDSVRADLNQKKRMRIVVAGKISGDKAMMAMLSPTQQKIVALMGKGHTPAEVATKLGLAKPNVSRAIANIREKTAQEL